MELEGRVALVTGAAGNSGPAVVAALAEAGARVALAGRRRERLERLAGDLGLADDAWSAHAGDLREGATAAGVVDAVAVRHGRLDVLVHLVGGWTGGTPTMDEPDTHFADMLERHLWSTLHLVRAVVPRMTEAGWGRIVAVSSPVVARPEAKQAAYAVGKGAEEALLGTVAREVAGTGVTANVLVVRAIAERNSDAPASATTPAELAAAIRYLCSDAAGTVNGARIPLHGPR